MMLRRPKTFALGVHYIKKCFTVSEVQQFLMQLTLKVGDDAREELSSYLSDFCAREQNCRQLSQFYFFLDCWKRSSESPEARSRLEKTQQIYLANLQKRAPAFFDDVLTTIDLVGELRGLMSAVKSAAQDRLG